MTRWRNLFSQIHPHYWLLAGISLLAHGLLLLNDGVYFDGWYIYYTIQERDWARLEFAFFNFGDMTRPYLHWAVGGVFLHKTVTFLCLLGSSFILYRLSAKGGWLSPGERLFISLCFLLYPADQSKVEMIMMPYYVSYLCFFGAALCLSLAQATNHWRHWAWRILGWALFGLAFWINSFLAFYGLFYLWFWVSHFPFSQGQALIQQTRRYVLRYPDLLLLPFVFWVIVRPLAQGDLYQGYNQISPRLTFFSNGLAHYLQDTLWGNLQWALSYFTDYPLLLLLAIFLAAYWRRAWDLLPQDSSWRVTLGLMGLGLWGLGLALLPYLAVGKYPSELFGWTTRHALLVALPLALLTLAGLRLLRQQVQISLVTATIATALLLGYGLVTLENYLNLQTLWVKNHSVALQVADLPQGEDIAVFWIDDRFPVYAPAYHNYYYHDWSGIFKYRQPTSQAAGVDYYDVTALDWLEDFPLRAATIGVTWDVTGCQAILTIQRGTRPAEFSSGGVSMRYFFYRYLNPSGLDDFLRGVTQVEMRRILAPQATACPIEQAVLPTLPPDDPMFTSSRADHIARLFFIINLERELEAIPQPEYFATQDQRQLLNYMVWRGLNPAQAASPAPHPALDADFYHAYYQVAGWQQALATATP
jgi:hypothetical protein